MSKIPKLPQNVSMWAQSYQMQYSYLKDPQIVPYPLATFKCAHAQMSWTCADFF